MDNLIVKLKINGVDYNQVVHPIFGEDVKLKLVRENNQVFFRETLDGTFTFVGQDFDLINRCGDNVEFEIDFYRGEEFVGKGTFFKCDCTMDYDNKVCEISLSTTDKYTTLMSKLGDTYNLVKLAPKNNVVVLTRRPILQLYVKGGNKVTNVIGGMYFEQDCTEVNEESELLNTYKFGYIAPTAFVEVTSATSAEHQLAIGTYNLVGESTSALVDRYIYEHSNGAYRFTLIHNKTNRTYLETLTDLQSSTEIARNVRDVPEPTIGENRIFLRGSGGDFIGRYYLESQLYGRILSPILGERCVERPSEDITEKTFTYPYVAPWGYTGSDIYEFVATKSVEPTEWGIDSEGTYFTAPVLTQEQKEEGVCPVPIGQSHWEHGSMWLMVNHNLAITFDEVYSERYVLKDACLVTEAIRVLLAKADSTITLGESQFLNTALVTEQGILDYPFPSSRGASLFISQITNVKNIKYSQAAQRGDVSLQQILDMLRNVFQCYWWIDEQNQLRIEHIVYFKNGKTYGQSGEPQIDVTQMISMPTWKSWGYNTNVQKGEKSRCPSRYEFSWGDKTTAPFEGVPIDVTDKHLDSTKKEQVSVDNFVADVDYAMASGSVSDDVFMLMEATYNPRTPRDVHRVDLDDVRLGFDTPQYRVQNPYCSFLFAEVYYYPYDLGGWNAKAGNTPLFVHGTRAYKGQDLSFPISLADARGAEQIRTALGVGEIESMEINADTLHANVKAFFPDAEDYSQYVLWHFVETQPHLYEYYIDNNSADTLKVTYLITYFDEMATGIAECTITPHNEWEVWEDNDYHYQIKILNVVKV